MQVSLQLNETSDTVSDKDDDVDDDNDTSSAASNSSSDRNQSTSEEACREANNKLHPATDRLSETQSSNGLTVTPIKIKCRPKRIRTMDRILRLKHSRRKGRPPLTQNMSFERHSFGSKILSPVSISPADKIRRVRGRPKGSKNKVKKWPWLGARQANESRQKSGDQSATDTLDICEFSSSNWPPVAVNDCRRQESSEEAKTTKKSKQTFWRPPTDADTRRVLDQISITDITANALTVTIRESATQDGFFR